MEVKLTLNVIQLQLPNTESIPWSKTFLVHTNGGFQEIDLSSSEHSMTADLTKDCSRRTLNRYCPSYTLSKVNKVTGGATPVVNVKLALFTSVISAVFACV